jgi:putative hydrolase of the HAD superfamily
LRGELHPLASYSPLPGPPRRGKRYAMKDPQALILDFDGLILDTETAHFQAWTEAYASYGLTLPLERWVLCVGTDWNAFNPYQDIELKAGPSFDRTAFQSKKAGRADELIVRLAPRRGIVEMLEDAKGRGLKLGVASSSDRSWVEGHLGRLGLRGYFQAVKTRDDVERVKPDPALYLRCLEALGVGAAEAVAFEDSPNGIKAAKAAGIFTFAYPNGVTEKLDLSLADRVLAHPQEWRSALGGQLSAVS